jgi:hypothetical protein
MRLEIYSHSGKGASGITKNITRRMPHIALLLCASLIWALGYRENSCGIGRDAFLLPEPTLRLVY